MPSYCAAPMSSAGEALLSMRRLIENFSTATPNFNSPVAFKSATSPSGKFSTSSASCIYIQAIHCAPVARDLLYELEPQTSTTRDSMPLQCQSQSQIPSLIPGIWFLESSLWII